MTGKTINVPARTEYGIKLIRSGQDYNGIIGFAGKEDFDVALDRLTTAFGRKQTVVLGGITPDEQGNARLIMVKTDDIIQLEALIHTTPAYSYEQNTEMVAKNNAMLTGAGQTLSAKPIGLKMTATPTLVDAPQKSQADVDDEAQKQKEAAAAGQTYNPTKTAIQGPRTTK